jgi:hypothetical protein
MTQRLAVAFAFLLPFMASAQMPAGMDMKKPAATASTQLMLTGIAGATKTLSSAEFKALPHVTVNVHNAHSGKDESYSGVAVKDLIAMVEPAKGEGPKVSANMTVVIAGATDNFRVAITLCDTNPDCRSGQAVAGWRTDQNGWCLQADPDGRQEACSMGSESEFADG